MTKLVPPRRRLPGSFVMNPRCAIGVPTALRPPPPHASPTSVRVMNASCRFPYSAPFGRPVVPDVNTMATGRSGSSASAGGDSPAARSSPSIVSELRAGDTLSTFDAFEGSSPGPAIEVTSSKTAWPVLW